MKCEEVDKLMIDYLDMNLDDQLRKEIEKHIETCERCLDEFKDNQRVVNLISADEMVKPDDSLRINFYHMLHNEIKKEAEKKEVILQKPAASWHRIGQYRIAAGLALLLCGTALGMYIQSRAINAGSENQLKLLQAEVNTMKKTAMFTMLKEESSSDRIQAVNYADELETPDNNVVNVLVQTLNTDRNVNVRMAAAYALAKFADQKSVCDSLVRSLSLQNDPILQVTLINILVERKEKSALKPIEDIIGNRNTLKEVRAVAENSLRVLM